MALLACCSVVNISSTTPTFIPSMKVVLRVKGCSRNYDPCVLMPFAKAGQGT